MTSPRMPRIPLPDSYEVKIVLDSIAPSNCRLTTFALTYPRFIHSELLTHRVFTRNSASSRAIPSEKMRALVKDHPALPVWWGKNQPGMQAREELDEETKTEVKELWLEARDLMLQYSDRLAKLGLHKQLCNRLTEPWMPITVLVSATSFSNFFHLRDHPDAQQELQVIATEMHYQYHESTPQRLKAGEWHLPYISTALAAPNYTSDYDIADIACSMGHGKTNTDVLKKISVGRCARVSYLTHEGKRDPMKDIELHDKLASTTGSDDVGHFSPYEQVAMALEAPEQIGNFRGWKQYRKEFANEAGPKND